MRPQDSKNTALAAACAAAVATVAGVYLVLPGLAPSDNAGAAPGDAQVIVDHGTVRTQALAGPLLVRGIDERAPFGDGQLYEISPAGRAERAGRLTCKRVHASADGPGLCLGLGANGLDYDAVLFDRPYRETARFPIDGVPDRARVSPDGRYGAYTAFDDSASIGYFASSSEFRTFTRILDMETGKVLLRLEDLTVIHEGKPLPDPSGDNFWGVTFAGGDRYYATAAVAGGHYLIEGSVRSRRARTIHAGVECPALSPDGRRIAYKRRIGDSARWRFHVLDLASGRDLALAERRSIDDQPEWLDDNRIVYSDDRDVFTVPADGSGQPVRLAESAASPVSQGSGS